MISALMSPRSVARLLRCCVVVFAALLVAMPSADAQDDASSGPNDVVLFVMDLSGSMNEPFDGQRTKLDVAKAAFVEAFTNLSPDALVGLRVYGDQNPSAAPGDRGTNCSTDSRLVVPVTSLQRDQLIGEVEGFVARGDTSISLALEQARADIPADSVGTIVLFSDGRDECHDADLDGDATTGPSYGQDPCAVAEAVSSSGPVDRIMTVGFGADTAAEAELRCIASATGGTYTQIETPADARDVLPELLVEFSTGRVAQRLGDTAIVGGSGQDSAPQLLRLDDPDAGNGIYTDSISMGGGKWYHLPAFGPDPVTFTATVFDLPADADIKFDMALFVPSTGAYVLNDKGDTNAGLPARPSASIRCGECVLPNGPEDAYWVVTLSSPNPDLVGDYDLELAMQGTGFGGPPSGCHEPQECWYTPALVERQTQLAQLQGELGDFENGQATEDLIDERARLRGQLDAAAASDEAIATETEELEALLAQVPPKSKSFRLPLVLLLGGGLLAFAPLHKLKRTKRDEDESEAETSEDDSAASAAAEAAPAPITDAAEAMAMVTSMPANGSAPMIDPAEAAAATIAAVANEAPPLPSAQAAEALMNGDKDAALAVVDAMALASSEPETPDETTPAPIAAQPVDPDPDPEPVAMAMAMPAADPEPTPVAMAMPAADPEPTPVAMAMAGGQTADAEPRAEAMVTPSGQAAASPANASAGTATAPTPGWYEDPADPSQYRWWTGSQWTEHTGGSSEGTDT